MYLTATTILLIIVDRIHIASALDAADQEFNPYIYSAVELPFKKSNYARDWFGYDLAFIQSPLAAQAKPTKFHEVAALPTIEPMVVSWRNIEDVHVNEENTWNFEKRVDDKVWWPQ